ncbi:3-deoxy-D-manno-octulosonic acid transferase [Algoriphagus algorifonticola]|uniref:3-deoxy-D-manno-octulosonic acid transferase n=1 Tax=Algoriphagus algorifonticola TaxID=2593007 RepID=UPI0011A67C7E|nr:glycosyltransferase N-terminal domain-containing protein [Algoriphagus algorifonticola]
MKWIYDLGMHLLRIALPLISLFSKKVQLFHKGRKNLFTDLEDFRKTKSGPLIWFHVASLGEFEQAKPVISGLKHSFSNYLIAVSFYSPSGFVPTQKKTPVEVDYIGYLPIDTTKNAAKYLKILQPEMSFFVKYDLWFNFLQCLNQKRVPTFLVAAAFRKDQVYFTRKGFFRAPIFCFNHIFCQNELSQSLLNEIGYKQHSLSGDTRFDRVAENAINAKEFPEISKWVGDSKVMVLGSIWEEDMDLLIPLINSNSDYQFIIAPHDIKSKHLQTWANQINTKTLFYSQWDQIEKSPVLIIDNIGMLSRLYQYATIAYVGGAFGEGLHNILEPIGFGVPVIFGKVKKEKKFPEAETAIAQGCAFSVGNSKELIERMDALQNSLELQNAKLAAKHWVETQLGASAKILAHISKYLKS